MLKPTMLAASVLALTAPAPSFTHVHQEDNRFSPDSVTILVGEVVEWDNHDLVTHTVTADDGSFDSGDMGNGARFERAFSVAGTYDYHCAYHSQSGMVGKVVVSDPTALPDLVISELAFSDSVPGVEKLINVTVRNLGLHVAGPSHAALHYVHAGEPHAIADLTYPELGPGERATMQVTWNTLGKVGDFTVTAVADVHGDVTEANEDNNTAEAIASVLVSGVEGLEPLALLR